MATKKPKITVDISPEVIKKAKKIGIDAKAEVNAAITKAVSKPIVTVGSHSVRTQYPDGRVDFVVDDEKLRADVMEALAMFASVIPEKKPAVKAKTARKKKSD